MIDGLAFDGLTDVYDKQAMGVYADRTAEKYGFTREQQDEFAIQSYKRSAESTENGVFKNEIVPVSVPQKKGEAIIISEDEEYKKVDFNKSYSIILIHAASPVLLTLFETRCRELVYTKKREGRFTCLPCTFNVY